MINRHKITWVKYVTPILLLCAVVLLVAFLVRRPSAKSWNDQMLNYFGLTGAEADGLESLSQNIVMADQNEAFSVHVMQTVGDGRALYLLYEITVPEAWSEMLSGAEGGSYSLSFDVACFPTSKLEERYPDLRQALRSPFFQQRSVSAEFLGYHPDRRCATYISHFLFDDFSWTGEELQFVLGNFSIEETEAFLPVLESEALLSVTWVAQNEAEQRRAETVDGSCTVSPLGFELRLTSDAPFPPTQELRASIEVVYEDGTTAKAGQIRESYAATCGKYSASLFVAPPDGSLYEPGSIIQIKVNGVTFSFPEAPIHA